MIDTKPIKKQNSLQNLLKVDIYLVTVVLLLCIIGLVMVFSSSWWYSIQTSEVGSTTAVFLKQVLFLVIGLTAAVIISRINYHIYRQFTLPMILLVGVLLIISVFLSLFAGGRRNLIGSSVQPSELAKITIIIYLSCWLFAKREILDSIFFGLIPLGIILGLVAGLIALQPDLSAAISIVAIGAIMFYLANGKFGQILLLIGAALIFAFIVTLFYDRASELFSDLFAGYKNLADAHDHVYLSMRAIIEGGLFGKGLGNGSIKNSSRLPVSWTDSIFSVIAEEFGLVGVIFLLGLYMVILWRGIEIAKNAPDQLGMLLAGGITFWIVFEVFMNIFSLINIAPFTGNALPFVSAGGTNLVTTLAAVGILLNVSRVNLGKDIDKENLWRNFGKAANLRRRNRRRSVSRANRTANTQH